MAATEPGPGATEALHHLVRAVTDVVAEVRHRPRASTVAASTALRLSDAERDDAAEILRTAFAEGRLDFAEFDERLTVVHAARVHADLLPALADLPGPHRTAAGAAPPDEVVTAVLREVRRAGEWELPPRLQVQARAGTVVLDLRAARARSAVVEIDVRVTAGRVVIIVPDGVPVELRDGLTLLGNRRERIPVRRSAARSTGSRPGPGGPPAIRLVVGGEVVAGQLVVRSPTARERWRGV